ncbi:MAG: aminopeptidase N [Candidatus Limnocylindria bacterium]
MTGLLRTEAAERSRLLAVQGYEIELDFTQGPERFRSTSRIAFECREPGASTFVDLTADRAPTLTLNGHDLDPNAIGTRRATLTGLERENELVAIAEFKYSKVGEGIHRFVDPADDAVYTYTEFGLFDANRAFACFDQPDLKAPMRIRVRAPESWTVISNGSGTQPEPGTWEFVETPPISTYLVVVVAGSYGTVHADHGPIRMGLQARRSLMPHLDQAELFEHTRNAFDYLHRFFDLAYPFGKYDQAFVPEFNMGAMENPGCVKFADEFVFRSRVTDAQRATRAEVIAHEMAHMWFGDLVTLRWWDDLWLNESFAEFMGILTAAEALGASHAWTDFCAKTKAWGYRQDELPSTHPLAADAPDTGAAFLNFDGISYAKGAGVLKQLAAWVGMDQFTQGLRAYVREHAYGNTTLADLLAALERASGRDLKAWSSEWLETAGVNTLRPESAAEDGAYTAFAVVQTASAEQPTLRAHRIAIGLYDKSGDRLVRRERIEVDIAGAKTTIPALLGATVPDLLLLNDDDLTWAKIRLDERSLATVRDGWLSRIEESLPRALVWSSAWDTVRDAELPVGDYVDLALNSLPDEREIVMAQDVLTKVRRAIDALGHPDQRDSRLAALAATCRQLAGAAAPASDLQLAYARSYASAVADPDDVARVTGWLTARDVPDGLAIDPELRWLILRRLAVIGAIGEVEISEELERDRTSTGSESAAGARAALPTPEAKAWAWDATVTTDELSSTMVEAIVAGFWHPEQLDLAAPYVARYFDALPAIWRKRSAESASRITTSLFPRLSVSAETIDRVGDVLAGEIDPTLRRALIEACADTERALRARELDAPA